MPYLADAFSRKDIAHYNQYLGWEREGDFNIFCDGESQLLHGLDAIPTPIDMSSDDIPF
jgi:hypothetical protein